MPPKQQASILRKIKGAASIEFFAKTYLPHYLVDEETGEPVDFADFHREIFALVEDPGKHKREAWAAPRGHAKSTIMCTVVILWWICYKRKRFVVIISDTSSQAEAQLQSVTTELEENELLKKDFGLEPAIDSHGAVVAWRDNEITVNNGVTVAAKGAGKSLRGLKKKQARPDAVIIDDLENDEIVNTKNQRDKLERWLTKTVLPMVSKAGDVYYIGTILHYDSVLVRTQKRPEVWNVRLWQAVVTREDARPGEREAARKRALELEEETEDAWALWPQYWPMSALAAKKLEIGSISFAQEYLNEPLEAEDHPIKREWFCYYDPEQLPKDRALFLVLQTVDPAVSEKTTADYTAICTLAYYDGKFWLIEMFKDRLSVNNLIKAMESQFSKHRPFAQGIESVGFQLSVVQLMVAKNAIPVFEIKRNKDKVARAIGVSVHFENGRVLFPRGAPWLDDLEADLVQFPAGANDDTVDALVDAIETFTLMSLGQFEDIVTYEDPQHISKF